MLVVPPLKSKGKNVLDVNGIRKKQMTWLIKIEVEDKQDADYITEHLNTDNPVIDIELEELSDE